MYVGLFKSAQLWLFVQKDLRVRKIPEYTAKRLAGYLWKLDIIIKPVTILQMAWWYKADNAALICLLTF